MTLTAWGLIAAIVGAFGVAFTTRGIVWDRKQDRHSIGSWLGHHVGTRFGDAWEDRVDRWGPRLGWGLIIVGFALQLVGELTP